MNYDGYIEEFTKLFNHQMDDTEMREFLISLKLDENTPYEAIAAGANVMRSYATPLFVPKELKSKLIDIVGTGGDKIGSFNISSTTAMLCSSAGLYVAKHGNRSITSKSGSADLFEQLGVKLDLSLENSAKLLEETGFTFMFAQNHHDAMKFIMPVRKSIDTKTVFNVLGPLTNPANASKYMLGVFDKSFIGKISEALLKNNAESAIVVSSDEGMDEISISSVTHAARVKDNNISYFEIDPEQLGFKKAPLEAILGGDAKENAIITQGIFDGSIKDAKRDIVVLNSASSFVVDGIARDMQDGIEIANEMLNSKKALEKLKQIVKVSSSF